MSQLLLFHGPSLPPPYLFIYLNRIFLCISKKYVKNGISELNNISITVEKMLPKFQCISKMLPKCCSMLSYVLCLRNVSTVTKNDKGAADGGATTRGMGDGGDGGAQGAADGGMGAAIGVAEKEGKDGLEGGVVENEGKDGVEGGDVEGDEGGDGAGELLKQQREREVLVEKTKHLDEMVEMFKKISKMFNEFKQVAYRVTGGAVGDP